MAQYSNLKAYIEEKIYENGTQAITGDILQDVLKVMTDDLGEFYQMGGVASPSTDPGTPDAKVIYFATEAGTYTNFGGITLAAGEVALLIFETSWTKETLNVLSAANGGVKTANLADGAVTTEKIAGGAVGTAKIANSAVTSGKVADGAIGTAKIADGAIDADKIAANAVESAKIKNGAVTEGKINDGAVTAGKVAANAVTTAKIADDAVTTAKLNDGAVTEDKIATDAVTSGKVKDGAIGTAKIAAGAVTHAKIGAGAVEESNIKDGAVTSDKIANGAVGSDQLAEGAFSAENLADGSVTTDKLADEAVTAEKIADGAVTAGKFANGSVTTIKLGSGAVTTEKIGDGMVTRQKLADSSVGTSKIIDGAVTTDKVADGAITDAKLENPVSVSQNTLSIGGEDKGELAGQLIESPEWAQVVTDSKDKVLYGVKTDGKFYFGADCPPQVQEYVQAQIDAIGIDALLATKVDKVIGESLIDADFASSQSAIENPEFLEVKTDQDGKILESLSKSNKKRFTGDVKIDGELQIGGDEEDTSSISVKEINLEGTHIRNIEDEEERIEIVTDADGKVVSYRKSNGTLVENAGIETNSLKLSDDGMTEFQQALKDSGFNPSGIGNWSDYISEDGKKPLCIPMPKGAVMINILSNFNLENLSKKGRAGASEGVNYDIPTEIEFWDMNGNYFKKKVFMSGQGNSSMEFPKKNIALDFFDSEYDGDAFALKFGDWVAQDSFHLKSYYTDAFRCVGLASYKLYDQMEKTRGVKNDYIYKRALIDFSKIGYVANGYNDLSDLSLQFETGAKCFPDGFPCLVYQNGTFWGLTCWQIKKHRDNYHMKKSKEKNIHLDGTINATTLFNGTIDWTKFEVRNPKNVVYATAHDGTYKYDADVPGQYEIAGNGTLNYPSWESGTYDVDDIVEYNGHIFINTVTDNASEPIIDTVNNRNTDSEPDFKNKTGCGWINCTLTVKVKKYVTDLSTRIAEISSASTSSQKKEKIETYFDVDNLIDYLIISDITRNYDGFDKNWQWLTYDGVKWFIGLYDLDGSFGGNFTGTSNILPLDGEHVNTSLMMGYVTTYYSTELNSRYASLRESKILDKDNIIDIVRDILLKFGEQNFEKEFAKWTNCPCNRNSVLNEHWEFDLDENGNPQLGTANYNNSTTYNAGDSCYYAQYSGNGEAAYKYKVKSTSEAVQGVKPVTTFGYMDSIYRLYNWIAKNIENLDVIYGLIN